MKKSIWLLIAFSFAFGLTAWGATTTVKREKILSPDQIKNYRDIIKEGNTLYGVLVKKIQDYAQPQDDGKVDLNPTTASRAGLEKILRPDLIPLYEKVQKVGNALWGMRRAVLVSTSSPVVLPENGDCVANAINIKDKAVMKLVTNSASDFNQVIAARSACQQAAVRTEKNQREEIVSCIQTYQKIIRYNQEAQKKGLQDILMDYRGALDSCQMISHQPKDETTAVLVEDGGNALLTVDFLGR